MRVFETAIPGVRRIEPSLHGDERGFFTETWSHERYAAAGVREPFVQDNISLSRRGTVRGLHLQHPGGQGKLVYVLRGEVFDVAVDVRVGSPTFGNWVGVELSGERLDQLWIPAGLAHGFCVTSDEALLAYKCTRPWSPEAELGVAWDDPDLGIPWPVAEPVLSDRDGLHPTLRAIDARRLPRWVQ